jgi:hypothetical protein
MLGFEEGIAVGQALASIRDHEVRLTKVEKDVATVKGLAIRGALLLLLWCGAVLTNLPADRAGELMASFLRAWSK